MFRPVVRAAFAVRSTSTAQIGRRFASTSARSGTWKGAAVRWSLAGAIVYYYNTSDIFAEGTQNAIMIPEVSSESDALSTVESIAAQRRAQARALSEQSQTDPIAGSSQTAAAEAVPTESAGELEQDAGQQGAFNEETGEINWDCPCLGGMAHGPCGTEFRAAFSCFIFSKEEPKGVDCIEHFKTMQSCFREHPEIYGSELDEDELAVDDAVAPGETHPPPATAIAPAPTNVEASAASQSIAVAPTSAVPSVEEEIKQDIIRVSEGKDIKSRS